MFADLISSVLGMIFFPLVSPVGRPRARFIYLPLIFSSPSLCGVMKFRQIKSQLVVVVVVNRNSDYCDTQKTRITSAFEDSPELILRDSLVRPSVPGPSLPPCFVRVFCPLRRTVPKSARLDCSYDERSNVLRLPPLPSHLSALFFCLLFLGHFGITRDDHRPARTHHHHRRRQCVQMGGALLNRSIDKQGKSGHTAT